MEFRFQKQIDGDIGISKNRINIYPVVIDYANTYKYNQYSVIGLIKQQVQIDGGQKYATDPAISTDNINVTQKTDQWNNPLFYQYQPKFDCLYPENINVYDKNGTPIGFTVEYGYTNAVPVPLLSNTEKFYDSFDSCTMHGLLDSALNYNDIASFCLDDPLPFTIYGSCLYNGSLHYPAAVINALDADIFSVYFTLRDATNYAETQFISNERGSFNLQATDGTYTLRAAIGESIDFTIEHGRWYRLDYSYDNIADLSLLELHDLSTMTTQSASLPRSMFKNGGDLTINAEYSVCFDLGFFSGSLPAKENPLYVHRYSKSIEWKSAKPAGQTAYRVRLLFQKDTPASIVYDGVDQAGNVLQNSSEEINYRLVYKKYSNTTNNDWRWDSSTQRIICAGTLADEVDAGTAIYMYPVIENQVRVSYDAIDKRIHVTAGEFRSDDYNGTTNLDYYHLPEYDSMVFASDGQTRFRPYYVRVVREQANLISPYTIQIGRFYMYEGDYPAYVIPNVYEVHRYYDANGALQKWTTGVDQTFITARGINIYKNGMLLANADIINYNITEGTLTFRTKFNADDKIEVTYLKEMPDFVLSYPILSPLVLEDAGGIGAKKAFRLYLRPDYPNYMLENPYDKQTERLCYKFLVDGAPVGDYKSCVTNLSFNTGTIEDHAARIIPIADISIITDKNYTDIRTRGGGITEEAAVGYTKSPAFLDIGYGVNGKVLHQSILLIKIPLSVLANLIDNYYKNDEDAALTYIKQSIERYLGDGIFYAIIDENNRLWKRAYPLGIKA